MKQKLENLKKNALEKVAKSANTSEVESLRIEFLGKKGQLTEILRDLGNISNEERPIIGAISNEVRNEIEAALKAKKSHFELIEMNEKLKNEKIDITLPSKKSDLGKIHPLSKVLEQVSDIFLNMGFEIVDGPEVETDYYNFTALNIPESHPARDDQDTFYISDNVLLRTQTSPVQIRTMEHKKPPIRMICPGKVYRSDSVDATHSPMFNQMEGLVVDKGITMGNLKGCLEEFVFRLYGEKTKTRFRPHHFQFTEPSAEMDVSCPLCNGAGVHNGGKCPTCKGEGWIEILGCGMVHRDVLSRCGIDPEVYTGFAFGMGLERITMRSLAINDLRLFYENDVRFLEQF